MKSDLISQQVMVLDKEVPNPSSDKRRLGWENKPTFKPGRYIVRTYLRSSSGGVSKFSYTEGVVRLFGSTGCVNNRIDEKAFMALTSELKPKTDLQLGDILELHSSYCDAKRILGYLVSHGFVKAGDIETAANAIESMTEADIDFLESQNGL